MLWYRHWVIIANFMPFKSCVSPLDSLADFFLLYCLLGLPKCFNSFVIGVCHEVFSGCQRGCNS